MYTSPVVEKDKNKFRLDMVEESERGARMRADDLSVNHRSRRPLPFNKNRSFESVVFL